MQKRLGVFLVSAVLVTALLGGWLGEPLSASAPLESETERLLQVFTGALAAIREHYVEPIPTEELVESAVCEACCGHWTLIALFLASQTTIGFKRNSEEDTTV